MLSTLSSHNISNLLKPHILQAFLTLLRAKTFIEPKPSVAIASFFILRVVSESWYLVPNRNILLSPTISECVKPSQMAAVWECGVLRLHEIEGVDLLKAQNSCAVKAPQNDKGCSASGAPKISERKKKCSQIWWELSNLFCCQREGIGVELNPNFSEVFETHFCNYLKDNHWPTPT